MNMLNTIKVAVLSGVCVLQLTGCKQSKEETETVQSLSVLTLSEQPVELTKTFSASIRGRQDVDIIPQVSGRITRLCVKEGERVRRGQVLAVIDQVPVSYTHLTLPTNSLV